MYLYRYHVRNEVQYEDGSVDSAKIILREFQIIEETDKTWKIRADGQDKRVLKDARRRFAYPTTELAMNSLKMRRRGYKLRLDRWLHNYEVSEQLLREGKFDA